MMYLWIWKNLFYAKQDYCNGGIRMAKQYIFPAIASKTGNNYGVYFPDFPGCIATGATLEEAIYQAKEGLALHILGIEEDGDIIPAPTSIEEITLKFGEVLCLLDANIEAARKTA